LKEGRNSGEEKKKGSFIKGTAVVWVRSRRGWRNSAHLTEKKEFRIPPLHEREGGKKKKGTASNLARRKQQQQRMIMPREEGSEVSGQRKHPVRGGGLGGLVTS